MDLRRPTSAVVELWMMDSCSAAAVPGVLLHAGPDEGLVGSGGRRFGTSFSLYVGPWGVSQNLILWEALQRRGIPAGNGRPHPCHWHSRGPPPLHLRGQRGNTHASLLPALSSPRVTGLRAHGQFVFAWFWVTVSPVVRGWPGQVREVTYCGRLSVQWYVLVSVAAG